jgi:hypothetical protein
MEMLISSAKVAVAEYIKATEPASDCISQREAQNIFGLSWFKNQLKEGNITGVRVGKSANSKIMFSKAEIIALKNAEIIRKKNIIENILKK